MIPAALLHHHPEDQDIYTAEASDLGLAPGRVPRALTAEWPEHPGQSVRLHLVHAERRDGDVLFWDLKADRADISLVLRIFND